MTKQQLNVRIPNITREQIDALTQLEEMTTGEVVSKAVERFYQQRKHKMIQHIQIEFSDDAIFGDYTAEDVDRKASRESFIEHLEAALYYEFPTARTEIAHGHNDRLVIDSRTGTVECITVQHVMDKVWSSYDWLI